MSINAIVETVYHYEDGSGKLKLSGEERGQEYLHFASAPHDVTALNGRQIWGGASIILYGQTTIARRLGYTGIGFVVESLGEVIAKEDRRKESRCATE